MEIQQLRYFVLTARTSSFKAAADEAYVSRAALSKSVAKLESELGYALFDRTRDGVSLTTAGRRFLDKAVPVVASYDELERTVASERQRTVVSVAVPISWTEAFSGAIDAFAAANPNVCVSLTSWPDTECVRKALSGEVDMVISHLPVPGMADEGRPLVHAPIHIAMSASCPLAALDEVTIDDLRDYDIAYYSCGYDELVWAPSIGGAHETFDNDMMHIYAKVWRGEAVFPTPLLTVPEHYQGIVCRRFRGPFDTVVMAGYITPGAARTPQLAEVCTALREALLLDLDWE